MTPLPWGLEFSLVTPSLELEEHFDPVTGRWDLTIRNVGASELVLDRVRLVAEVGLPAVSGFAWLQGRAMNDDALCRVFGDDDEAGYSGSYLLADDDDTVAYRSAEWLGISLPTRAFAGLVIGSLDGTRYFTDMEAYLDADEDTLASVAVTFLLEGEVLAPGAVAHLPPLSLSEGTDVYEVAAEYIEQYAAIHGARIPVSVPSGWCSWYSLARGVSEADVLENVRALAEWPVGVDVVQVDDGYQEAVGDWLTPNAKFPSGMDALATRISDAGFRPGLWLAPLVMHEDSAVLRDNPGFALPGKDGGTLLIDTWMGRCAVLDCSNPRALDWLRGTVRTITGEWGYSYLKLDGLVLAAQPRTRATYHDPSFTAARNVRAGLEAIREAAGDETFLLGCTAPFAPAVGLVDAMRVGPDVKTTRDEGPAPGVRHAMRMALQRNVYHRRWWLNDPDCMLARDDDTELTDPERRFLATSIALSGGLVFSGDDARSLAPGRRRLLEAILPPAGLAAEPMDMENGPVPSAWRIDLQDGRSLIGVLNWADDDVWVHPDDLLAPGEVAFDAWNGHLLHGGDIHLAPHDGALLQVAESAKEARVIGDAGHVAFADLRERRVSGRVQAGNDRQYPRRVAVEARRRAFEVTLQPGEQRWFD